MELIDAQHGAILMCIAKYIRAHNEHKCPISVLMNFQNIRTLLRNLVDMRMLVIDGDSTRLTIFGWAWICEKEPNIIRRIKKGK